MQNVLRDYQQQAVQHAIRRILENCYRMYLALPTGTGKSRILAALACLRLAEGRVLILIHRQDIALQLLAVLRTEDIDAGLLMQGHRTMDTPVVVATTQSLSALMLQNLLHASEQPIATILIDEAHHATEGSAYQRIITAIEGASPNVSIPVIGFTATPYRHDKQSMLSLLPTCAFERTIPDMVQTGRLAPLTWKPVHVDIDLSAVLTNHQSQEDDYLPDALATQLVRAVITKEIVQLAAAHIEDRPTLVFAVSIEHAEQLAEVFRQQGFQACAVSGMQRSLERAQALEDWRAGHVQVVCNCSLLTEGFDFPAIAALVIARPTRSPGLYLQMLGRGTRPAPGKRDCLVLDVMGNHPDTSQQVVLPQIIGDTGAKGGKARGHTSHGSVGDPFLQTVLGAKTETNLSLLDPIGQSWYRWTPYHHKQYEGYFTKITIHEAAIIERDLRGSGLYRSRLHVKRPRCPAEHSWICQDYLPLRQQVALVHEATGKTHVKTLGSKAAPWLEKKATEKQLQVLQRMHPLAARRAREKGWTQQMVSDMLTFLFLKPTLTHPPEGDDGSVDDATS